MTNAPKNSQKLNKIFPKKIEQFHFQIHISENHLFLFQSKVKYSALQTKFQALVQLYAVKAFHDTLYSSMFTDITSK